MPHTFTVTISDLEYQALLHDLLDPEQWVADAVAGKVSKCMDRMTRQGQELLLADPSIETMPANREGLARAVLAHPGYKSRKQREAPTE